MALSPQFLDELRARVPLAQVIGRRVRLIRKGREFLALCPFHNEKTPSFTLSDEKGFFHCFGCGAHGDVIGFVMRDESLSFPEAVEKLADEAGLPLPKQGPEARERAQQQMSLYGVLEAAATWFEDQLAGGAGSAARDYLESRGLKRETIKTFRIGFAPNGRSALKSALRSEGISEDLLVSAGLLIEPEGGGDSYDRFRGRVMFPIMDRRGRAIAFGGRALGDGQPKYLNSPDTPLFQKGSVLYGLHLARSAARKAGRIIAAEGYMDVIALHQAGFVEAVAPLGTALTELQIEELWRVTPEAVLCFDGDRAGQLAGSRAAERALPHLRSGFGLRFAALPEGDDPDTLVRSGGAASMEDVLAGAEPLSARLWRMAGGARTLDTPEQRAAVNKRLSDYVERIQDPDLRFYYQRHYRNQLYEATIGHRQKREGAKLRETSADRVLPQEALGRDAAGNSARRERTLLQTLLNFPALLEEFHEEVGHFPMRSAQYRSLRDALLAEATQDQSPTHADIAAKMVEAGFDKAVNDLVGTDARYLDWAARAKHADLDHARLQLRHLLDLHHRLIALERERQEAEQALAAEPTDENWLRLVSAVRAAHDASGAEAHVPGYAENGQAPLK